MKNYLKLGMLAAVFGFVPSAQAVDNEMEMNKYAEYREDVEASQGASDVGSSEAWQHANKYAIEQATSEDMGGTLFPAIDEAREELPKNFKNNVVF